MNGYFYLFLNNVTYICRLKMMGRKCYRRHKGTANRFSRRFITVRGVNMELVKSAYFPGVNEAVIPNITISYRNNLMTGPIHISGANLKIRKIALRNKK